MTALTPEQIKLHEAAYDTAVDRHELAERRYSDAKRALAVARGELNRAERARQAEWKNLSSRLYPSNGGARPLSRDNLTTTTNQEN